MFFIIFYGFLRTYLGYLDFLDIPIKKIEAYGNATGSKVLYLIGFVSDRRENFGKRVMSGQSIYEIGQKSSTLTQFIYKHVDRFSKYDMSNYARVNPFISK